MAASRVAHISILRCGRRRTSTTLVLSVLFLFAAGGFLVPIPCCLFPQRKAQENFRWRPRKPHENRVHYFV